MSCGMKPTLPQVIDEFLAYHAEYPAWGVLHLVLDDGNVSDANVRFCHTYAKITGDEAGMALAAILLTLSKTQRKKLSYLVGARSQKLTFLL